MTLGAAPLTHRLRFGKIEKHMDAVNHVLSAFLRSVLMEMKRMGVTQTELARRLDVSRPYLCKVLHGDVNISFGSAARLAAALGKDFSPRLTNHRREKRVAVEPT